MSDITDDIIRHAANLSKFKLDDQEISKFRKELQDILGYVKKLQEVDTRGVEPTAQVSGLKDVSREDKLAKEQTSREELLKNVPDTDDNGNIVVKKVL